MTARSIGTSSGAGGGAPAAAGARRAGPRTSVRSTHVGVDAGLLEQRVQPRRVRALGQPEAAAPSAPQRARGGRRCPVAQLQPDAGVGGEQRQHGVGRRRSSTPRAARARASRSPPERVEARRRRARSRRARALELGGDRARPPLARPRRRARAIGARSVAQERAKRSATPGASSWSAEHRRERERDGARRARVEHVEQRQVRRRHRLPQPLLAERPRPEALDVGHVGVQDERELAAAGALTAGRRPGSPARRSRSRRRLAQREVARRDRRREAVVEAAW